MFFSFLDNTYTPNANIEIILQASVCVSPKQQSL